MLSAVHSDRTGRMYVSSDYHAAGFDGVSVVPLARWLPLPEDVVPVPLPREAQGFDRAGRARTFGRNRWAVGAVLPPGFTRLLHPAYRAEGEALPALPFCAVGADEGGRLVAAALVTDPSAIAAPPVDSSRVAVALRGKPGTALVRQLARCAREYACAGAVAIFDGKGAGSIPIGGDDTDLAERLGLERAHPSDPAAFRATAAEIADVAGEHLAGGGTMISFGRACDGEPLAHARLLEDAITRIRSLTRSGLVHLETDGRRPQALRRLLAAGLGAVTVRLGDRHGGWLPIRESLAAATAAGALCSVALPVFPGVTDQPAAADALLELLATVPEGTLLPRDRAGDPHAVAGSAPLGVAAVFDRLARELPRWRVAAFPIPAVLA